MAHLHYRKSLILAGLLACVSGAVVLVQQMERNGNPADKCVHQRIEPMATADCQAAQTQVTTLHSSSAQVLARPMVAVPASVRQILPQLDQRIDDWRQYQPQKLMIAPYADLAMEFEMTLVRQENGRTVWRGRNALTGAFLVTVATANDWHAVLEVPASSSFEFHISGQTATVTEKHDLGLCGNNHASAAENDPTSSFDPATVTTVAPGNDSPVTGGVNTVDVLFFYDAATLAASGYDAQQIETTIASRIEAANVVLENSKVDDLRWRYVAAYQVPDYTATSKMLDDLEEFTDTSTTVGDFVSKKCTLHGVDQAVLFVNGPRDYAGLAWVPNRSRSVAHQSAVVWNSSYIILAHEMAHNFGCRHDRQTEKAASDDGKYWYGYRFNLNGTDTGTVMSYASFRLPYFSNPDVSYSANPLGVAHDQPDAANDSRVLRDNAALMAGYREASLVPIITAQPQSTTVPKGSVFDLSVSAAGKDLSYQWRKNGVVLPGANSSIYTKSGASESDVGAYDVIVSNSVGQAESVSAALNISTAEASPATTSPSTTSNAGGSGGGGGGAMSDWAMALLALVGLARFVAKLHRR